MLLKPLEDALANGDPIRAVILARGSIRTVARSVCRCRASRHRRRCCARCTPRAGVAPDELAFFEMHGTGTAAGDPDRSGRCRQLALGQSRSAPLPIGSVKTNIGHLEPASGMAGLLKAALALDRGIIPPTLHCETPNPNIPFDALNLRLVRDAETLQPRPGAVTPASTRSVLAGPMPTSSSPGRRGARRRPAAPQMPPLVISARTEASLRRWPELVRHARQRRRPTGRRRCCEPPLAAATIIRTGWSLGPRIRRRRRGMLADFLNDEPSPSSSPEPQSETASSPSCSRATARNSPAWGAMRCAPARLSVRQSKRSIGLLRPQLGWSVAELLADGVDARSGGTRRYRAALALRDSGRHRRSVARARRQRFRILRTQRRRDSRGLGCRRPLARRRRAGRRRAQPQPAAHPGQGRMAALALASEAAGDFLAELDSPAEIAALNATHSVTISGPGAEIERLEAEAKRRGLWFRALDLDFAFHSREMDRYARICSRA